MFKEIIKTISWGGKTLELSTGKVARQADGAVLVKMGQAAVLCTAVFSKETKEGIDFFPLTVHYREMAYAAGKIPGGFFKREGKASEKEVLVSRLIDRPIRPLFHNSFFNETQVICTVISHDPDCCTDILAIIGASAALAISGAPYLHFIAASKVGLIGGEFVLNPSFEMLKNSKLDLVVAGTKDSVMMVESEAHMLSEEKMLDAVKFGHDAFQPVIELINDLVKETSVTKWQTPELKSSELITMLKNEYTAKIKAAFAVTSKHDRVIALKEISSSALEFAAGENSKFSVEQVKLALKDLESQVLREDLLENNRRIDGRKPSDIRQIACEVQFLPKTHGSSLFTRGETQALVVATLGTSHDEQMVDSLDGEYKEHFMLNYIFPPYSVGEATPMRAPGRRETGHGKLAWRAINPVLPSKDKCPYTIRVVSEITESNGSSSMATVCGASMALMDAGVGITAPVAGIAMGLIKDKEKFVVLSDIMGDEDHFGDMDFKVAGTEDGITALQMDIKITGITFDIMSQALSQAKDGRLHILGKMNGAISNSNQKVSKHAPAIQSLKINKDKIRDLIGPGGKIIREICETTGAKIDISDDGNVSVFAVGAESLDAAIAKIKAIAVDPEVGDTFEGKVVKIIESGAFVNYLGNRDGFVHVSEISDARIESVASVLKEGDSVKVQVIGKDNKGRTRLSMKSLEENPAKTKASKPINQDSAPEKSSDHETDSEADKHKKHKKRDNNHSNKPKAPNADQPAVSQRKYFN